MSTPFTADQIRNALSLDEAKDMVRANLIASDAWLIRGLLAIYAKQTADEQQSEHTKWDNDVGFNATDSTILSSFAKQVIEWNDTPPVRRRFKSPLSPKGQIPLARKKMLKYAGQLVSLARASAPKPELVAA